MNGDKFLKDLREFVVFLTSLWGVLTGISAIFPLFNTFIKIIPLGGIEMFSPELVTAFSTLSTLFVVLSTFCQRGFFEEFLSKSDIRKKAKHSFLAGILAMLIYFIL